MCLTRMGLESTDAPETAAMNLAEVEGKVLQVRGESQGGWLYSAKVLSTQFFRANVGIILLNADGEVLALKRSGKDGAEAWQLPQGGVDELEEPREAAERELFEELGLEPGQMEFLREHPDWLAYELPPESRRAKPGGDAKHGRGQVQKWFLVRFVGDERRIDLSRWARAHEEVPEFDRMQWTCLAEVAEHAWEPRRVIYRRLAEDFAPYLKASAMKTITTRKEKP